MSDTTPCSSGATTANSCAAGESASKSKARDIQNGKGDAPRNISARFRSNYDQINWGNSRPTRTAA